MHVSRIAVLVGILLSIPASLTVAAEFDCSGVSRVNESGLKSVPVIDGLAGDPLLVLGPPGDPDLLFVVEQEGYVWRWVRGSASNGSTLFLDIHLEISTTGNEAGVLGMAFDPDWDGDPSNGDDYFYVSFTEPAGTTIRTVVRRYRLDPTDPTVADVTPAEVANILGITQPPAEFNHNGGHIEFGPDGFLYVNTGDGGGSNDNHGVCGNGQNTANLHGKMLRLDVRNLDPEATAPDCFDVHGDYGVPSDNPLADGAGGDCDEIWAYGLRNPWRSTFDPANGDLYIADVGQRCWEEINYAAAGTSGDRNYGWRQMEGPACFDPAASSNCNPSPVSCPGSPACDDPSLTDPVSWYPHGPGCSITGGYVYRGCRLTGLQGRYLYGDYCAGFIESIAVVGGVADIPIDHTAALDPGGQLSFDLTSFGQDARGELYFLDRDGIVNKILPLFSDLEVSGAGAADRFRLNRDGNWTWEDLAFSTMHPVDFYRVYRGAPGGDFACIQATTSPEWVAGDPMEPDPGELLAYVVTAVESGEESASGDPPRTLTDPCAGP